jgi:hypothetical protein
VPVPLDEVPAVRSGSVIVVAIVVLAGSLVCAQRPETNPEFTFSIGGPCGETIYGFAGTTYDDGTWGRDLFFDRDAWDDGTHAHRALVPNNRPGHTWDVLLTTRDNPVPYGSSFWCWGLSYDGALSITDVTTLGTTACSSFRGPTCLKFTGYERTEVVGPPYGAGGEEDRGALSWNIQSSQPPAGLLPAEGTSVVAKIRVFARFPDVEGEEVSGRLFFTPRTIFREGLDDWTPELQVEWVWGQVKLQDGNPPLRVEDCEVRFRAVSPLAPFIRCDPNDDGTLNIADPVWIFTELFRGGRTTRCPAAADCNGDRARDISDGIYGLSFLFRGTPPPPAPFPACGRVADMDPKECPFPSTRCPP